MRSPSGHVLAAVLAAAVLAAPATAFADKRSRVPGTELTISTTGGGLVVSDKTRRAPFPLHPWGHDDLILDVDASAKGDAISIQISYNCAGDETIKTTTQVLRARLENAGALALHAKQRWDEAAAGFARALALDPTFELAALNLASAQARGGHTKEAVATLLALAQQDLPLVVWRTFADPDLASLASDPSLHALAVATAGTATHATPVSYSAAHHLIAWTRTSGDLSGASSGELRVVDAVTGKPVLIMPGSRTAGPSIDSTLAALGFVPVPTQALEVGDTKAKTIFAGTKIGVVVQEDHATILTGNHVLGEGSLTGSHHHTASLTPESVVLISEVVISEGCGGDTYDVADVISLRAPPPAH